MKSLLFKFARLTALTLFGVVTVPFAVVYAVSFHMSNLLDKEIDS